MPLIAARLEEMTNAITRIRVTLMPARRAASALPPTAYMCRPKLVRDSTKVTTSSSRMTSGMAYGMPARSTAADSARSWLRIQVTPSTTTAMSTTRRTTSTSGWWARSRARLARQRQSSIAA